MVVLRATAVRGTSMSLLNLWPTIIFWSDCSESARSVTRTRSFSEPMDSTCSSKVAQYSPRRTPPARSSDKNNKIGVFIGKLNYLCRRGHAFWAEAMEMPTSTIVFSGLSPHPPILVPEIGKDEIQKCIKSRLGLQEFSKKLRDSKPEILVLITPHGPVFHDAISIYTVPSYHGDFGQFGCPEVAIEAKGYPELALQIHDCARAKGIPIVNLSQKSFAQYGIPSSLDHATMVPLYYFNEAGLHVPLVLISMGLLPFRQLFDFGSCIRSAIENQKSRVAVVASGDLSHRLIPGSVAGYDPIGKEFDQRMIDLLKNQDAEGIMKLDQDFIERAGECGFRPILMMLGATHHLKNQSEVISYEGPFGVGYGVVAYSPARNGAET